MQHRLLLYALLVIAAVPSFAARRRAVSPGAGRCSAGIVSFAAFPVLMASDGPYLYWLDEFGGEIRRTRVDGSGNPQLVGVIDDGLYLSMAVDDTHVYIGILPFEAFLEPRPGSILSVPKDGGTVGTLISGVNTPWDLEADGTHLYWAALGTLRLFEQELLPDGKIERARKDGSQRQALAEDLSAPFDVAVDDTDVYFGETGAADGDPTMGFYRVAKSGGPITTILDDTLAAAIDVAGNDIVFWGGNFTSGGGLFHMTRNGAEMRKLFDDETIVGAPRIFGGRVYFIAGEEESDTARIRRIDLANPDDRTTVFEGVLTTDDFVVDECSVMFGDANAGVIRRLTR
ncbi:MAG TPA: hypothetical protein VHK90_03465 [Thermoanaerobaculia bacterium]|nr:hypothetical protein [Thermoanaerobaculia bacterium]